MRKIIPMMVLSVIFVISLFVAYLEEEKIITFRNERNALEITEKFLANLANVKWVVKFRIRESGKSVYSAPMSYKEAEMMRLLSINDRQACHIFQSMHYEGTPEFEEALQQHGLQQSI